MRTWRGKVDLLANDYLMYSCEFELRNKDELDFAVSLMKSIREGAVRRDCVAPRVLKAARSVLAKAWSMSFEQDDVEAFEYSIDLGEDHLSGVLSFADSEHGDPYFVGVIVMELLKYRGDPSEIWTMTWANTCDSMRVGHFSGGYVIVTAKGIQMECLEDIVGKRVSKRAKKERK